MTLTLASSFMQQHHRNRVQAEDSHGLAPSSSSTIVTESRLKTHTSYMYSFIKQHHPNS